MIDDMLRESWVYKEWQREVEERVGKQNIIIVVQACFPVVLELAQKRVGLLKTSQQLQQLLVQIALAQDEEEARDILLAGGNEQS